MTGLLGLQGLPARELERILDRAAAMKRARRPRAALKGRTVALLFFEPSTRTRASFEVAARRLGADVLNLPMEASSARKGESLEDTLRNLEAIGASLFVVRHPESGAAPRAAKAVRVPVVNAGDGTREHPTQALLDLFTLRERWGSLKGRKVAIVGDILHSRVARSNLHGLRALGARVALCGPAALLPKDLDGAELTDRPEEALAGADAAMALRIQLERQPQGLLPSLDDYVRGYSLTEARLKAAKPGCLVLHPGPVNRGVELPDEVADGPRSLILEQARNGVFVRMAVFELLLGASK